MKTNLRGAIVAIALAGLSMGCISTDETVYRDPDRLKVEFENDAAGRNFYEALVLAKETFRHDESKTQVSLPVIFEHKHRVVDGENVAFNTAVQRCDTNNDGRVTELESRIFLASVKK